MSNKKYILSFLLSLSVMSTYAQDNTLKSEKSPFLDNSIEIFNTIEIYPNPSVEYLIVEIVNSDLLDIKFEMRSIIGNEVDVIPENIGRDKYRFNVKEFASGYYFIIVKDENSQFKQAHKFLKK